MKTFDQELPASDRRESPEPATPAERPKKIPDITKHDAVVRSQLLAFRIQSECSNNDLARKTGVSSSVVSQYLNEHGCIYTGDVAAFERKAIDLLKNEARRRASGVETVENSTTKEVSTAFEYVRKTNDVGAIIAESGNGKSCGIEPYMRNSPTSILFHVRSWHKTDEAVRAALFDAAPRGDYDNKTNRMEYAVRKLRGSDRLLIVDDAHKLTMPGLQCLLDFHDETHMPIALVGTFNLLLKLERDPQMFSRIGLKWVVGQSQPKDLVKHLVKSLIPTANGEFQELCDLAEQVAREAGHFRAVHKQLKLTVEMRENSSVFKTWTAAFRSAHTKMLRTYKLQ